MLTPYLLALLSFILVSCCSKTTSLLLRAIIKVIAFSLPIALLIGGAVDNLSSYFLLLVVPVSIITSIYASWYSNHKYSSTRLEILIDLFNVSIIYTFASPNLLGFITLWTISEVLGFLLVAFEGGPDAFRAGYRFFFLKAATFELSALTLVAILSTKAGIDSILLSSFRELPSIIVSPFYMVLLIIGYITTAALVPLHFWLPHAHSTAPAPASAILSGITVKMGFYALLRINDIVIFEPWVKYMLFIMGGITCVYGFLLLLGQQDYKRMLAYSTIGNSGLITILLSMYLLEPSNVYMYLALLANIYAHGLYKASLFLNAGTVEAVAHTRLMSKVNGLVAYVPISSLASLFSVLSVIGIPPTIGFIAKLLSIIGVLQYGLNYLSIVVLLLIGYSILVSLIYGVKILRIHWETDEKIDKNYSKLGNLPQFVEIAVAILSIAYGYVIPVLAYTDIVFVLTLVNLFSLLIIFVLVYTFYFNIRLRIMKRGVTRVAWRC